MAGSVTGIGTTYNLPNYHGELFALTPADAPLLSAIGGLTGGMKTDSAEFEWQSFDLRDPAQRTRTEGATAPTAEERVRGNIRNVAQIHQEKVEVSYTKQASIGQVATPSSAPYRGVSGENPVSNELDWQVEQALKSIALDVNYSFINGRKNNPSDNTTARRTGGLIEAITTNVGASQAALTITGLSSATDTITEVSTGVANGDKIVFTKTGDATGIVAGRVYFVVSKASGSFKVALTSGGSAITLGTSTTNIDYIKPSASAITTANVDDLAQMAYDNGGLAEQFAATLVCNSAAKRGITAAWASAYGKAVSIQGNVGGVNVTKIQTDFGDLNLMLDRHMPQDALMVLSLEQLAPVFLEVPGKGVFFEEPLAKTGSSDAVQIYGEIGLKYGVEKAHAIVRGLKV